MWISDQFSIYVGLTIYIVLKKLGIKIPPVMLIYVYIIYLLLLMQEILSLTFSFTFNTLYDFISCIHYELKLFIFSICKEKMNY